MKKIKAFCFDVFGTVVDWRNGVAREAKAFLTRHNLADCDPYDFADAWRGLYQPAMQACRGNQRPFTRLDVLHRENLDQVLARYKISTNTIGADELAQLNRAWHRLDPWPDVITGLNRLKKNAIIAPASNGNIAIMVNMAKRAGIPWDAILGAEVTRAYKPTPDAYLRLAEVLSIEPQAVCMVAAHNYDLSGARQCGLATAFVPRPTEHGPNQTTDLQPTEDWDFIASDFNDLAARVGC